jgi:hypothetical protein
MRGFREKVALPRRVWCSQGRVPLRIERHLRPSVREVVLPLALLRPPEREAATGEAEAPSARSRPPCARAREVAPAEAT